MKPDFTLSIYKELVSCLERGGYTFQTVHQFINDPAERVILLRHDVDARKEHSLQFAWIQHERGISGTYYFRLVPESFDKGIIREIAGMGHEIGYHYETMDTARGNPDLALRQFEEGLERLREIAEVRTACMHGSPLSKYDNRDLWKHVDYREYGIVAEPYFDLDFSSVLYITDTGRRWDGDKVSVRDRSADATINRNMAGKQALSKRYHFRSTGEIIRACKEGRLPDKIMINFHPQRWTDSPALWTQELVMQNLKNVAKRVLRRVRG